MDDVTSTAYSSDRRDRNPSLATFDNAARSGRPLEGECFALAARFTLRGYFGLLGAMHPNIHASDMLV